jgi:DNA end-binding protein Ku
MERSGKVAVVQVALRQRESLAALRSRDGVLVLETLLWPDEVRVPDFGFLEQDINVRTQELKMAASLIDSMSQEFDPEAHHDGYREALTELVEAKVEGRDVIQPGNGKAADDEPVSLADALKASIAAAKDGRPGRAGGPRKTASPSKTGRTAKPPAAKAADDEEQAAPAQRRTRRRASA